MFRKTKILASETRVCGSQGELRIPETNQELEDCNEKKNQDRNNGGPPEQPQDSGGMTGKKILANLNEFLCVIDELN